MLSNNIVFVLIQEQLGLISNITSVMIDCEVSATKLWLTKTLMISVLLKELSRECLICGFWKHAGFIEKSNDSRGFLLNEVQDILVVDELNVAPVDGLLGVLFLLHLEYMLIKMLLELLIGQIDTELLKTVEFEAFKAIDIEDTNGFKPLIVGFCI